MHFGYYLNIYLLREISDSQEIVTREFALVVPVSADWCSCVYSLLQIAVRALLNIGVEKLQTTCLKYYNSLSDENMRSDLKPTKKYLFINIIMENKCYFSQSLFLPPVWNV